MSNSRSRIDRAGALVGILTFLLAACGDDGSGDGGQVASNRPSQGAPAPITPLPPTAGGGIGSSFEDVFGPPIGRLPGAEAIAPEEPVDPPPPTEAPGEPSTPPGTQPPGTMPPVPTEPPNGPVSARVPVAAIAPNFEVFIDAWIETNNAVVENLPDVTPIFGMDDRPFATEPAITIDGGTIAALRLDGGLLGVLTDVNGEVVGVGVFGNPGSAEVISATATTIALLAADQTEFDAALDAYVAAGPGVEPSVFAAVDGGHWIIEPIEDAINVTKQQDANLDSARAASTLLLLDAASAVNIE